VAGVGQLGQYVGVHFQSPRWLVCTQPAAKETVFESEQPTSSGHRSLVSNT
jgi:hypothetical protein